MRTVLKTLTLASVMGAACAQTLSNDKLEKVKSTLARSADKSWEVGTRMQALLSLDTPSFNVLNSTVPPPKEAPASLGVLLELAKNVLNQAPAHNPGQAPVPLYGNDSSAADPASTGVGILIANWTGQHGDYDKAARSQVDFLLNHVPRSPQGAISHRLEEPQLWSDFIYMVPPFFAYYGATTHNQTMVREAYNQIKLYRDVLRDPSANNLWKHIVLGTTHADPGHWSTGNAWVAAGILRVVGTIQNGPFANELGSEKDDLLNWVREIHDGMFKYLQPSNMWRNYADADKSFDDAAGTALLAASVYRINTLAGESKHLNKADEIRKTLFTGDKHVGTDGWLKPVVDPMDVGNEGKESPEGQAFVLELHAAYRDWNATGGHTTSGASAKTAFSGVFVASVASLVAAVLMC